MPHLWVALSAHGYGHAAQTAPIVNALRARMPRLRLTLRTDLPRGFLAARFAGDFELIPGPEDFGLIMESALAVAHAASAERYARLHARWEARVARLAAELAAARPDLVVSNSSYLALAAAHAAGIPAVAVASFTWAQIYAHYFAQRPETPQVLAHMRAAYHSAVQFLALEPGMPLNDLPGYCPIGVVARRGQPQRAQLRERLGLGPQARIVLFSLGGVSQALDLAQWPSARGIHWLVPKAVCPPRPDMTAQEDLGLHFTDLLASADAFITKAGYGSFAEAACNGVPVLYVPRGDWPEEPYLVAWMERHARVRALAPAALQGAGLTEALDALWRLPPRPPVAPDAIERGARRLAEWLPG